MRTCSALLPPLCCLLLVLSLLRNPRSAWAQPSNAARALTRARLAPAGPSRHRHIAHRGRYPLQETPRRPLEPQGCRRDLRKARTSPRTTATPGAMLFSAPQCTFYSSHPLRTPIRGEHDDFRSPRTCTPPLVSIKGGGEHHFLDDLISNTYVTRRTHTPALLSPDIGTCLNHLL